MTSIETQSFQLISHSRIFYLLAACENEFVKSARVTLLHNTAVVRKMRRRQSSFPRSARCRALSWIKRCSSEGGFWWVVNAAWVYQVLVSEALRCGLVVSKCRWCCQLFHPVHTCGWLVGCVWVCVSCCPGLRCHVHRILTKPFQLKFAFSILHLFFRTAFLSQCTLVDVRVYHIHLLSSHFTCDKTVLLIHSASDVSHA